MNHFDIRYVSLDQVPPQKWRNTCYTFILLTQGSVTFDVEGNYYHLEAGNLLFIPCNRWRQGHSAENESHEKYVLHFKTKDLSGFSLLNDEECLLFTPKNSHYLQQRLSMLHRSWMEKSNHYKLLCEGMLLELICLVEKELHDQYLPSKKVELAEDIKNYIVLNYSNNLTINDIAKHIKRSPNHAIKVFKEVTGHTPIEYMHFVRINAAVQQFRNSSITITAAGEQLGYYDPSHFNRTFTKVMGTSPSQFMARTKKD